jgi:hypothetical protein
MYFSNVSSAGAVVEKYDHCITYRRAGTGLGDGDILYKAQICWVEGRGMKIRDSYTSRGTAKGDSVAVTVQSPLVSATTF